MKNLLMAVFISFITFSINPVFAEGYYDLDSEESKIIVVEVAYCNIAATDMVVKIQAFDDSESSAEYAAMEETSEKAEAFKTSYLDRMNKYGELVADASACPRA